MKTVYDSPLHQKSLKPSTSMAPLCLLGGQTHCRSLATPAGTCSWTQETLLHFASLCFTSLRFASLRFAAAAQLGPVAVQSLRDALRTAPRLAPAAVSVSL